MKRRTTIVAAGLLIVAAIVATSSAVATRGDSGYQDQLVADGKVTTAEMSEALQLYADCIDTLGVDMTAQFLTDQFSFGYVVRPGTPHAELAIESKEGQKCYTDFVSRVEFVWADQHPRKPDRFEHRLARCLGQQEATNAALDRAYLARPVALATCVDALS